MAFWQWLIICNIMIMSKSFQIWEHFGFVFSHEGCSNCNSEHTLKLTKMREELRDRCGDEKLRTSKKKISNAAILWIYIMRKIQMERWVYNSKKKSDVFYGILNPTLENSNSFSLRCFIHTSILYISSENKKLRASLQILSQWTKQRHSFLSNSNSNNISYAE